MALIECPDCGRKVSDRAAACPDCACPVAEVAAELKANADRDRIAASREMSDGQVDCLRCDAKGYYPLEGGAYGWCVACEHTGRLLLAVAEDGYYGVAAYAVEKFLAAEIHPATSGVVFFIGATKPSGHRFEKPAAKGEIDPNEIPW